MLQDFPLPLFEPSLLKHIARSDDHIGMNQMKENLGKNLFPKFTLSKKEIEIAIE
jgi:hypothetical protein